MSTKNDGGPAFPSGELWKDAGGYGNTNSKGPLFTGMSQRAYFAGQALAGLAHGADSNGYWRPDNADAWPRADLVANACVQLADALIAELNKA